MASKRKQTNELEFQGQVVSWLNDLIAKRPGIKLNTVTQEKPRLGSGKRNDLVVWADRSTELAFLTLELKTPSTPINDPAFFGDAFEKAKHWKAPYFGLWNMREFELYATPASESPPLPTDAIKRSATPLALARVEDWLKPAFATALRDMATEILEAALDHKNTGRISGHAIDAEIFVSRLTEAITQLRGFYYRDLVKASGPSKKLQAQISNIAVQQGFKGFVEDIHYAIAGQASYRFIGQILFYFALRRKLPALKPLHLTKADKLPDALQPFWNDVRRYDYEALFKQDPIEILIPMAAEGQTVLRTLIDQFSAYDWASLTDDVLGSVFEHLIPREEQILLGQFYTPRPVADLLVAFTIDGERPLVLDPGCGSGTFLMSAYSYLAHTAALSHKDLLSIIWGFDISPFAAELAVINLYRQDMAEYENFPRIVPGNFFDKLPGSTVDFPPPRAATGLKKVPVPIPQFDCVIGNPPYLRSQNQDDLDPAYRITLFQAAMNAGVDASSKSDLFAFFIYHAVRFMKTGTRLGFVTPASWLTADYAVALQKLLLGSVRLVAVIGSAAESFFPQVDVNAVLLVAEKVGDESLDEPIRFITLKRSISQLTAGPGPYWDRVKALVQEVEAVKKSVEGTAYRVKVLSAKMERDAIHENPAITRNWSKHLRAPLSYDALFEGWSR